MATLFHDTKTACDSLLFVYSLQASKEFLDCADIQLTRQFENTTGLKAGKNVCFSWGNPMNGVQIYGQYLIPGTNRFGRKLNISLYVNHHWNPVTICWKSRKGTDYKLHDTVIDCNDIQFWFEHLNAELYIKQLYPDQKLPFKTDNFSFELDVVRINLNCSLIMKFKKEYKTDPEIILKEINAFIASFNTKSENENREFGVVHNWDAVIGVNEAVLNMDMGSAGLVFFKKLLKQLSGMECWEKIIIE